MIYQTAILYCWDCIWFLNSMTLQQMAEKSSSCTRTASSTNNPMPKTRIFLPIFRSTSPARKVESPPTRKSPLPSCKFRGSCSSTFTTSFLIILRASSEWSPSKIKTRWRTTTSRVTRKRTGCESTSTRISSDSHFTSRSFWDWWGTSARRTCLASEITSTPWTRSTK